MLHSFLHSYFIPYKSGPAYVKVLGIFTLSYNMLYDYSQEQGHTILYIFCVPYFKDCSLKFENIHI